MAEVSGSARVLRRAIELLGEIGWCQGSAARNIEGRAVAPTQDRKRNNQVHAVSLYGAVAIALVELPALSKWETTELWGVLGAQVKRELGSDRPFAVITFNDLEGMTADRVALLLGNAADEIEETVRNGGIGAKAPETAHNGGAT